jgi:hypothetical protein
VPRPYDHRMTYGTPIAPVRVKPPISGVDLGISITALMLTFAFGGAAGFLGVFLLAFIDTCPPATCSVDGALTAVGGALLITATIAVAGLVATVVALIRRARAWPYAVGALLLCVTTCVIGFFAFSTAVGF